MRNALKSVIFIVFVLLASSGAMLSAAPMLDVPGAGASSAVARVSDSDLEALQGQLNSLKQQVSQVSNYNQLEAPQDLVQALIKEADRLSALLLPDQAQLQSQLGVLSPAPLAEATLEESDIASQRAALTDQKNKVDYKLGTLAAIKASAAELLTQIAVIRRSLLETEVTQRNRSILNPWFSGPAIRSTCRRPATADRIHTASGQHAAFGLATGQAPLDQRTRDIRRGPVGPGPSARRTRTDLVVHSPHARGTTAPQRPRARVGRRHGADRRYRPACTVFCPHPRTAVDTATGRVFRGIRKNRLHLRDDHRFEPCAVVHPTSIMATAGHCRRGGTGDQTLSPAIGCRLAGGRVSRPR